MTEPLPPPGTLPPRTRRRTVMNWILGIAFAVLLIGWLMARFETHQLYYPTPLAEASPADWGLPYEDVEILTEDEERLRAWWLPQESTAAPLLLFFHGNAGNRGDRLHNVAELWRRGIAVLIFDYRGYGGSTGAPSEKGLLRDGQAAFDWLSAREPGRPITLFGRSLGAAVAANTALTRPVAKLILESAFTSAPEMAKHILPIPGIHHMVRSRFDTLAAVRELTLPLLVIHGELDELVPFSMGRTLFAEAATEDKAFHAVSNGHHNDTYILAGGEYWNWIGDFLELPRPENR